MAMDIKYVCPFWGCEGKSPEEFLTAVKTAGYEAFEINVPQDPHFEKQLAPLAKELGLELIAQQWLETMVESASQYAKRLDKRLHELAKFEPIFINSHTGRDYFSFDENCRIIDQVLAFEEETGIPVYHETHRGRFNYSAPATMAYLKPFPNLKFTADLSHWLLVSESNLDDQGEALEALTKNARYIHARIGDTQRSQVGNPFDPELKTLRESYEQRWAKMVEQQKLKGANRFYICPEFGPKPYLNSASWSLSTVMSLIVNLLSIM